MTKIYSTEIIYIMAHRNKHNPFHTPDRKPVPDTRSTDFSTTAATGIFKNLGLPQPPPYQSTETNHRVEVNGSHNSDKLNWFQARAAELRVYLNECPKIDKRKIREIFNWTEKGAPEHNEQRKLLKELGHKVRGLIKENNQLKHTIYKGEITDLRVENQRLKYMLDQLQKGQADRKKIIIEENEIMKDFIENQHLKRGGYRTYQNQNYSEQNKYTKQGEKDIQEIDELRLAEEADEYKQPLFNCTLLSLDRLQNLKEYFTMYVNTVIEENGEKIHKQQKEIDRLQKRIIQLEKVEKKLQHFRFENKVKLQSSERKSKNYTVNPPIIHGDTPQNDDVASEIDSGEQQCLRRVQVVLPVNYYRNRQRTTQHICSHEALTEQISNLKEQNRVLLQNLQNLQQKYEVEIENHLRDINYNQKLLFQVEKLSSENKLLKVHRQSRTIS